jgi:hypothetical protein
MVEIEGEREMRDLKGYYSIPELGENVKYPSVTKIIGVLDKFMDTWKVGLGVDYLYDNAIGPFLAGDMTLEQFREIDFPKLVADAKLYHKDVSNEAMDYGSRFHKAMDDWHKNGIRPVEPGIVEPFIASREWEELVHLRVIESEGMVWSHAFRYAGTRDVKCEITLNKEPLTGILDFKTRNGKGDKSLPVYPSDKQQVAAYVMADEEMSGDPLDFGGIVIINRETMNVEPHILMRAQLIQPGLEFIELARYYNMTRRGK